MLIREFRLVSALKIMAVGTIAGISAFMFAPFVLLESMTSFTASFAGLVISIPVLLYFLNVPDAPFNFEDYWSERGVGGMVLDSILTVLVAMAPGIVVLYGLLSYNIFDPVPVASATAVAVFTGYSAFLYRNRAFYTEDRIDIEL
jgi:hypothetical protein